ncbi:MAG: tRNA (adenosine(37)-N6)-dimethylallyltransferase MiaA [Gemmatimonadetes bacterium]|nr:tRNA (adenosine(37)-N6)-dimethylallyltransferase MiaA [Gemmatimonadota bacterium]
MGGEADGSRPIAIVGPTASGKTSLAIEVARRIDGEILSLDSRQAYEGFEIGTAAPTSDERGAAPHHGVGFLAPEERYGAGRFVRCADDWLRQIARAGRVPILAGGTGLFLRALTHPMFAQPDLDEDRRAALATWLAAQPAETVRRWAHRLDATAGPTRDRQRAERTVELSLLTGAPLSWWIASGAPSRRPLVATVFSLELPAEVLRARIRERMGRMLSSGAWQEEVSELLARGLDVAPAFDALGYREVARLVAGEQSLEETEERIFRATWQYARRQRTWFRHQLPEDAVLLDGTLPVGQLARRITEEWRDG